MINLSGNKVNVIHLLFGYFLSFLIASIIFNSGITFFPELIARTVQLIFILGWLFLCFYDDRNKIFSNLIPKDYKIGRSVIFVVALIFLAINFRIGYESMVYNIVVFFDIQEELTDISGPLNFSLDVILMTVTITPVLEEIFYRAALISCLRRKHSLILSIVISSVIFALMHLNPFVFISGILLSLIYVRFGLVASTIFHSVGNLTLIYLDSSGHYNIIKTFQGPLSLCIVLACLIFYWKKSALFKGFNSSSD